MNNFFKVKIRYDKMQETGMVKSATEEYLVDALSYTECEKRIIEEMQNFISGEFSISDISRFKVSEAFLSDVGDFYFKARLYFISYNERGVEKKTGVNMLVQADDIEIARKIIEAEMKKTMTDHTIQKIEETKILDVFSYSEKEG